MIVARETVLLGYADELRIAGDSGERVSVTFPAQAFAVLANHEGTALYVVPLAKSQKVDVIPQGRGKGKSLHRRWAARDVDGAYRIKIPNGAEELHKIGYAEAILYTSDKWVDKPRAYIHDFKKSPVAYADRLKDPRVFGILSTRGAVLVTSRGIVG